MFLVSEYLSRNKPECSILSGFINVCDSSKQRTQDDLGVVFEEVDLHGSVCQMHNHSSACPEPGLKSRDTRQLVLFANLVTIQNFYENS